MKIAAVRSNLPERNRVVLGPVDCEANTSSVRREMRRQDWRARYREQLVRAGSIGVRLVYVGGFKKYEVVAVGGPCAVLADDVAEADRGSRGQRQTPKLVFAQVSYNVFRQELRMIW